MLAEKKQPDSNKAQLDLPVQETRESTDASTAGIVVNAPGVDITDEEANYPQGIKLALIILALCVGVFCVALDQTIIATATPRISDDFNALQDIGWYGSGYLLTTCAFQLFYGKLYTLFNTKWVFMTALVIFEVGSVVCGAAPSSVAFIVGRAIAGLGASGIFSGALIIIAKCTPVHKRPMYTSLTGIAFTIASVLGPLIGGAFTDHVTWRWCFYINLPLGTVTAAIILPFLNVKTPHNVTRESGFWSVMWSLDPIGTLLFVPSITCLLLALQWGGSTYAWNDGRIIALLTLFSALLVGFIGCQVWLGETATVPLRVARQRTIAFGLLFSIFIGAAIFLNMYYIPVWFQAIMGTDALTSGIHSIPLILSMTMAVIFAGAMTTKLGHYMPFVYASVVLTSVGAGLTTTFNPRTTEGQWIGYQILLGFGVGLAWQIPQICAGYVLPAEDVPVGVALSFFGEMFGGAIFVSVGSNVLNSHLIENIRALDIPSVDALRVVELGATQLRNYIPTEYLAEAVEAYNEALVKTFQVGLITACLTALGAAGMEWRGAKQISRTTIAMTANEQHTL